MITTEVRTLSPEDLNKIQNGIEQCLLLHLTLNETKNTLQVKAKVIPEFTEFAWKKLEEANPEFFRAYNFRLILKDQVTRFNQLLERQAELMAQLSGKPITKHMSGRSHIPPQINQNSVVNGQDVAGSTLQPGDILPPLPSTLYLSGESSSVPMQGTNDISNDANTASTMLMTQSSNMGLVRGMNGLMQPNSGYLNGSTSMCGLNGNVLDASHPGNTVSNMLMNQSSNMGLVQGLNGLMQQNSGYLNGSPSMCGLNGNVLDASHPANTGSNMLMTQSSNMGLVQGLNGLMQPNSGYLNGSPSMFGLNGSVLASSHPANTGSNMLMTQSSNMGLLHGLMQPNSGYGSPSMFGLNDNVLDASHPADTVSNILMTQSSNMGLVQGLNGLMQPNSGYLNGSPSMFGLNGNVLDASHPVDTSSNMLMTQSSNMGLVQGLNGLMQPNSGYLNGSPSMFGLNGNVLDANHPANTVSNMLMTQSSNVGPVQGLNGLMQPNSGYLNGSPSMFGLNGNVLDVSHPSNTASNMLMTHSSNMGLVQGMNGLMQPDSGYLNGSPSMFGHTGNILDFSHPAGDIPVSSYRNVESHSELINNNTLLGAGASYDNLRQIPRNFSLSDLEILVGNSEPHFSAAGSDSSVNAQLHVEEQDNRNLNTIPEDLDTISEDLDTTSEDLDTIPEGLTSDEDRSD